MIKDKVWNGRARGVTHSQADSRRKAVRQYTGDIGGPARDLSDRLTTSLRAGKLYRLRASCSVGDSIPADAGGNFGRPSSHLSLRGLVKLCVMGMKLSSLKGPTLARCLLDSAAQGDEARVRQVWSHAFHDLVEHKQCSQPGRLKVHSNIGFAQL